MEALSPALPSVGESSRHERATIKLISAIIRPEKLEALKDALGALNLVGGITLIDVRGSGRQRGALELHMGVPYRRRFLDKVRLEMAVSSDDVETVVELIRRLASTGKIGDGKIFIMDVMTAMRIRTGERGIDAL